MNMNPNNLECLEVLKIIKKATIYDTYHLYQSHFHKQFKAIES